jgi:RimJ/RimL family protein N-acetyltransferase
MKPIIETERIILREFTLDDIDAVFEFGSNKIVNEYTGDVSLKNKAEAKNIIENINFKDYKKYGYGRWAVVFKETNKVIGFAGLKLLPEFNETDIGFRFLPEYWNKGIATEVSKEIINYGFKNLKLKRIIGIADPKNIGSCKVLEKIGMTFYKSDFYDDADDKKYNWYEIKRLN